MSVCVGRLTEIISKVYTFQSGGVCVLKVLCGFDDSYILCISL